MPQRAWRNRTETSPPHCAPHFTRLRLGMFACVQYRSVFKSSSHSLVIFSDFVFVSSCYMLLLEYKHIIREFVDGAEQVISHFFHLSLHVIFFLFFWVAVFISAPLSFSPSIFVSHFFCCMQISFSLFDCQLWWHSDLWSSSRPEGHCTACLCVLVQWGESMPTLWNVWLFVYVWHSKSLFLVTSITVSLCQLNLLSLYPLEPLREGK